MEVIAPFYDVLEIPIIFFNNIIMKHQGDRTEMFYFMKMAYS